MSANEEFKAIVSKLRKDEFYTFLCGFSVGLCYFLTFVSYYVDQQAQLNFYIRDTYYILLFLLASFLLGTFFVYLTYLLISWPLAGYIRYKIKNTEYTNPVEAIVLKHYENYIASYSHLYGLLSSCLLFFILLALIFFRLHTQQKVPCVYYVITGTIASLFYFFAYYPKLQEAMILKDRISKGNLLIHPDNVQH